MSPEHHESVAVAHPEFSRHRDEHPEWTGFDFITEWGFYDLPRT